jgi:hypothetical protein
MVRFSILDLFLISGTIFNNSFDYADDVAHDGDNTSDHKPIVVLLMLNVEVIDFKNTPKSRTKATVSDIDKYCSALSEELRRIGIRFALLLGNDLQCHDPTHCDMTSKYTVGVGDASIRLHQPLSRVRTDVKIAVMCLDGQNKFSRQEHPVLINSALIAGQ